MATLGTTTRLTEKQISDILVADTKPRLLGCTNCVCLSVAAILLILASGATWSTLEIAGSTALQLDAEGIVLAADMADPTQDRVLTWTAAEVEFCAMPGTKFRQICQATKDTMEAMGASVIILMISGVTLIVAGIIQAAVYAFPCSCTKHGGARRLADHAGITLAILLTVASLGGGIAAWSESDIWVNDVGRELIPDDPLNVVHGGSGAARYFLVMGTLLSIVGIIAAGCTSYHVASTDTRLRRGAVEKTNPISRA